VVLTLPRGWARIGLGAVNTLGRAGSFSQAPGLFPFLADPAARSNESFQNVQVSTSSSIASQPAAMTYFLPSDVSRR
jgi:hypothetical protein